MKAWLLKSFLVIGIVAMGSLATAEEVVSAEEGDSEARAVDCDTGECNKGVHSKPFSNLSQGAVREAGIWLASPTGAPMPKVIESVKTFR